MEPVAESKQQNVIEISEEPALLFYVPENVNLFNLIDLFYHDRIEEFKEKLSEQCTNSFLDDLRST